MDSLKLHLLLNYYPAIGFVVATTVLAGGLWFRKLKAKRFALKLILFVSVITIAVVFSGEFANLSNGSIDGPRAGAIQTHKLTGTLAFVSVLAAGAASIVGLIRGKTYDKPLGRAFLAALLFAIAASILLTMTVIKGRQIKWTAVSRHTVNKIIDTENKLWHA